MQVNNFADKKSVFGILLHVKFGNEAVRIVIVVVISVKLKSFAIEDSHILYHHHTVQIVL